MSQLHYPEEWGPSDAHRLTCVCGNPDPFHADPPAPKQTPLEACKWETAARFNTFRVRKEDPANEHSAWLVVMPGNYTLALNHNTVDAIDEARANWIAHTLNAAFSHPPAAAEPVAHMWQHPETGNIGFVEHAPLNELAHWEHMNRPRKIVAPLYAAPSPQPTQQAAFVKGGDLPAVHEARKAAEHELRYYRAMQSRQAAPAVQADDKLTELLALVAMFVDEYPAACSRIESLASDLAGPTQEDLRRLVDVVWQHVGEGQFGWPDHATSDALITKALGAKGKPE